MTAINLHDKEYKIKLQKYFNTDLVELHVQSWCKFYQRYEQILCCPFGETQNKVDLFSVATKGRHFQFNKALYEQTDGVAMGSHCQLNITP